MEHVDISRFNEEQINYLDKLRKFIGCPLYFYGSIQRLDYFSESDVDIDIFGDNEEELVNKLSHFFNKRKQKFTPVIWTTQHQVGKQKIVHGYKVSYKRHDLNLLLEISVYNTSYKQLVLYDHTFKTNLPLWTLFLLYILKIAYYKCGIISLQTFKENKKYIMNVPNSHFIKNSSS